MSRTQRKFSHDEVRTASVAKALSREYVPVEQYASYEEFCDNIVKFVRKMYNKR